MKQWLVPKIIAAKLPIAASGDAMNGLHRQTPPHNSGLHHKPCLRLSCLHRKSVCHWAAAVSAGYVYGAQKPSDTGSAILLDVYCAPPAAYATAADAGVEAMLPCVRVGAVHCL